MAGPREKYTQASSLLAPNLAQFAIIDNVGADRMAFFDSSQGKWTNLRAGTNLAMVGTDLNVSFALAGFVTGGVIYWDGTNLVNSANFTFDGTTVVIAGSSITSTLRLGNLEEQSVSVNNVMIHNNGYFDGTNFRYRANGFWNSIQSTAGGWAFLTGPSGTAGNIVSYTPVLTIANTGAAAFSSTLFVTGTITGTVTALKSATTSVDVSAATAPTSGQALIATSSTTATWQTPTITAIPVTIPQGGTNATSFGTNNALVYFDGTRLVDSGNALFDGTTVNIAGSGSTSTLRLGTFEHQTIATNNAFIFNNGYFDGANFKYRTNGFFNAIQYTSGGWAFLTGASGTAGNTVSYNTRFTLSNTGQANFPTATATDSVVRIGVFEWETVTVDNSMMMSNGYFDGANFKYRANGYFGLIQFINGGFSFITGPSGTAGNNVVYVPTFTLDSSGNGSFAGTLFVTGTITGAVTALKSATTSVNVSAATAPTVGQVLTATDSTHATWQTPFQKAYLTADFSKVNTTLANVTDLTLNLVTGHIYKITLTGVSNSTGTGQCKMDFNGGSATIVALGIVGSWLITDDGTVGSQRGGVIQTLTSLPNGGPAVDYGGITITFTIAVNAGGTLIPRYAQNSLDGANASLLMKYATITAEDIT